MKADGDVYFQSILQAIGESWLEDFEAVRSEPTSFKVKTKEVLDKVIEIGEEIYGALSYEGKPVDDDHAYYFHFRFVGRLKDIFLLYRDLFFQHLRGKLLMQEGGMSQMQLEAHWGLLKGSLTEALTDLNTSVTRELKALSGPSMQKQIRYWSLQNNPWPIYLDQLKEIVEQGGSLITNAKEAMEYSTKFQMIDKLVEDTLDMCLTSVSVLHEQSGALLEDIDLDDTSVSTTVVRRLKHEEDVLIEVDFLNEFSQQLEMLTTSLPKKWEAIVGSDKGLLLKYEVELKNRVGQWLEGEIMPILLDVFEHVSRAQNTLRMAYSNMRNRGLLIPPNSQDKTETNNFFQPLQRSRDRLVSLINKIEKRSVNINDKLSKDFHLSKLFTLNEPFLPITMQTTIRQFGQGGNKLFAKIIAIASTGQLALQRILSKVEQEESLGNPEKISRFIERRKPHPANEQYNPIFLTKGFLGSSFASGRSIETKQFQDIFRQWEIGYRGAILLTGRRLCGKTFFGEWMANLHFSSDQVIKLEAGQDLQYHGRKLSATHNLEEVFDFVKKYTLHHRPLIWVDDLELWQDASHTLYENTIALRKFIDHFANRCFLLVAVNNWAHTNLQTLLDIDAAFQATIHLNKMSRRDLSRAILIRHGATHKKLIDDDGSKLSAGEFKSLIGKIDTAAYGNIGEALRWWLSSIRPVDENTIAPHFSDIYNLPRNFDPEVSLVLSRILLQKRTDEYQLRKYFGRAFSERYSDLIRRLINMGLLVRLNSGHLEVQETLVNALGGRLLDRN
jgi:hypothetical protein